MNLAKAAAYANNDVALIAWSYPTRIPNCLGFSLYRKEASSGSWEALPAWVGFEGESNDAWTRRTTEVWPIQKFLWKDLTAELGKSYSYRVVPATGEPGALKLLQDQAVETTVVSLTPVRGSFQTFFNRGILSTQYLSHLLPQGASGSPSSASLMDHISKPGDPIRAGLAGQILEGVQMLLKRAAEKGGSCYLALYELADPELIALLLAAKNLHIILSNTGDDDEENHPVRESLHAKKDAEVLDRFVPSGHIGHNKFCLYVSPDGKPEAVLLGSTNWTVTGLCAQSNNALIVESPEIAAAYLAYWQRLKDDTTNQASKQGPALRRANASPGVRDAKVDQGTATLWCSPNTPHARTSRPDDQEAAPPDLAEVFRLMEQAKEAILFLEFMPGVPSVIDCAARIANQNPGLFVRGAVTDPKAVGLFNTTLVHRAGEDPAEVVAASAVQDQFSFWHQELLKSSPMAHAIIHDKIVVIDPLSPNCVVITGSHNHGYRASYNNDENLLIVQGHRELAKAYAVHVMDVYDHYRFRFQMQNKGKGAFSGLDRSDAWQNKYFDPSHAASQEFSLWLKDE